MKRLLIVALVAAAASACVSKNDWADVSPMAPGTSSSGTTGDAACPELARGPALRLEHPPHPPRRRPVWLFNFAMEINLGFFSGTISAPSGSVTLIAPDGSGYDFRLTSSGWVPNANLPASYPTLTTNLDLTAPHPQTLEHSNPARAKSV